MEAKILRMKSKKTAHVEVQTIKFIPKYERYLVRKSKFAVHVPDGLEVSVGDIVLCGETRKLSKTKSMVIIKKLDKENKPLKERGSRKQKLENPGDEE